MDLQAQTVDELGAILREIMHRADVLVQLASEKFKESELAGWDESLYQHGRELLVESRKLFDETAPVAEEVERRVGPEVFEELMGVAAARPRGFDQRWYRKDLTTSTVPTTSDMDEILPWALENLLSRVPGSWWRHQQSLLNEERRNAVLQPLLLCGRERRGMDFNTVHRYAYYLSVAGDHLRKQPLLDMYTAARAVPQICSLGMSLEHLKDVKGADLKLRELCRGSSSQADATIFELLVAAAFARMGYDVVFVETASAKTPDLRIHGLPIPLVAECKRRQPLNAYELREFSIIREVFSTLCAEREELGLVGEVAIDIEQELVNLPAASIVQSIRDMTRTLSPYAAVETEWGSIHLKATTVSTDFEPTRLYSPEFLHWVFGIDLELDDFDGICAIAKNSQFPVVDRAELPFLMKWTSNSEAARERKLQTVRNLWIEAVDQIPTGEAGLIYLAYEEGHRPALADARTDALRALVNDIYFKRRAIAMPMTVVSRLLPNVVSEGRPDFIESTIPLVDGEQDEFDFWTEEMPTRVFVS